MLTHPRWFRFSCGRICIVGYVNNPSWSSNSISFNVCDIKCVLPQIKVHRDCFKLRYFLFFFLFLLCHKGNSLITFHWEVSASRALLFHLESTFYSEDHFSKKMRTRTLKSGKTKSLGPKLHDLVLLVTRRKNCLTLLPSTFRTNALITSENTESYF